MEHTSTNAFTHTGSVPQRAMLTVCKRFEFEAAHRLEGYDGPCACWHGHSYRLDVEVGGSLQPDSHMLVDFAELKRVVHETILCHVDHSDLTSLFDHTTAEAIVCDLGCVLVSVCARTWPHAWIRRIRLYETRTSFAEIVYDPPVTNREKGAS